MGAKRKEKWIKSYKNIKKPPHWALSLEPSKLAVFFLSIFKKNKLTKEKVLEIGCGNGRDSLYFTKKGLEVVGIDISAKAIALAKKNKEKVLKNKILLKSLHFKKADAEKLPFPDEYFGGIYSIAVLHSTNLRKSIREIFRVLKKGGIAIIHLWQKTIFLQTGKVEESCPPEKLKAIIKKFPIKTLKFSKDIQAKGIDYEEGDKNPHRHLAIIMVLFKKK